MSIQSVRKPFVLVGLLVALAMLLLAGNLLAVAQQPSSLIPGRAVPLMQVTYPNLWPGGTLNYRQFDLGNNTEGPPPPSVATVEIPDSGKQPKNDVISLDIPTNQIIIQYKASTEA